MKKILLLGSGELGKEFVIACQRLGQHIIAVDSYANAPAMQVADEFEVISMLDGEALDRIVAKHQPDFIVPEIEAIRTERFYDYEKQGIKVIPSAKAANFTMNRKAIRDLAAIDLGVRTATYSYATNAEELRDGVNKCGMPCVVKPLMSSSGKGQSVIRTEVDIEKAWTYACEGSRGDLQEVIVEGFIDFDYEITLLTVTQNDGPTLFCPPIGHRQERGDYQESWQPMPMNPEHLKEAQDMAAKVTAELGGAGIWGVEFFITAEGAYFSELSPRPHDTGKVTLGKTQNLKDFDDALVNWSRTELNNHQSTYNQNKNSNYQTALKHFLFIYDFGFPTYYYDFVMSVSNALRAVKTVVNTYIRHGYWRRENNIKKIK